MRAWIRALLIGNQHKEAPPPAPDGLSQRVHRLEIALAEQRERLDSLEGRHASLSASVRGRLGGRPKASPEPWQGGMLPINNRG